MQQAPDFVPCLERWITPAISLLGQRLQAQNGLDDHERPIILDAARLHLEQQLHSKVARTLVLDINALRVQGRLQADGAEARWDEYLQIAASPAHWQTLGAQYPTLLERLQWIVDHKLAFIERVAAHFATDRERLADLLGQASGALLAVEWAKGDSHNGGAGVALIRCTGGTVVYKPRPLNTDIALAGFLDVALAEVPVHRRVRVPAVLDRGSYGWSAFVEHRHANGEQELKDFYRNMGHWLAIMRLLGGTDFHGENVIAQGCLPIIVDCETLFCPRTELKPSGFGEAIDRADEALFASLMKTGLLPGRGASLGWRGVDNSGMGNIRQQQPRISVPTLVDAGRDTVKLGQAMVEVEIAKNHPCEEPMLERYWGQVLEGYDEITARLRAMHQSGGLAPLLDAFKPCHVRLVPRATEVYAELVRMLWHPISLADEGQARVRARALLGRAAAVISTAPSDPKVIEAEIDDMLRGDIPYFHSTAGHGQMQGPGGTHWLPVCDLVQHCLDDWLNSDQVLDRDIIKGSLLSAYLNDGWMPSEISFRVASPSSDDLDARRRRWAREIVERFISTAIRGRDGSVTWIAPTLGATGWGIQAIDQNLYGGNAGVALFLAAYQTEAAAGRADAVPGVTPLLDAVLQTMKQGLYRQVELQRAAGKVRPHQPGAYLGIGSQIWGWLKLEALGVAKPYALECAALVAEYMQGSIEADQTYDILAGAAGAIPALLALAQRSGQAAHLDLARAAGDHLLAAARRSEGRACWPTAPAPEGMGGFGHGAAGIGWALLKLHQGCGEARFFDGAREALAFEESLFDPADANWRDLRHLDGVNCSTAWCHGAVGNGLAYLDLVPLLGEELVRQRVRQAAGVSHRLGLGWNHCACHGDASVLELLQEAADRGLAPRGVSRDSALAELLSSLDAHGSRCGITNEVFSPSLMTGPGGIAYQLLRAHPDAELPSFVRP
ncbi:type 2 lanthipeptide synthetase LanM family protein [Paucibacter sp. APW11]|uniref:Type 2 lanthipeptide synthetase LanM family protein n=1 Tax=Roseateles aquae TaxID=3077235 RepID=A0ABU3P5L3_9BURK|nr:type 2 lanthipeptide synthetase LanM family protein [Paucibacter sp. APW11]MDT8997863.1 type 2 lanthipeptide synthetase LanM family protein [Paucibacter sp. APW11]